MQKQNSFFEPLSFSWEFLRRVMYPNWNKMKSTLKPTMFFILSLLCIFIVSCTEHNEPHNKQIDRRINITSNLEAIELADELLIKLRNYNVDTIIFYKRVCINCCVFYNIFYTSKGKVFFNKFYFDPNDRKTHSISADLISNKIFNQIKENYTELKQTSLKGNSHKQKDGTLTTSSVDHYCYTKINIYAQQDSIISDDMMDQYFDQYLGVYFPGEERETNDNYLENINSKWNTLLTTIENELASMNETSAGELRTLRTLKTESPPTKNSKLPTKNSPS